MTGALALFWLWLGWYSAAVVLVAAVLFVTLRRRRREATIRTAGLRARADYEHRLTLAGDPHGTYGRYPPADWYARPHVTQAPPARLRW